jgi:hypothetical protein
MIAAALTAVALTASAPVPVTGGTGAERVIVRTALAALDPGAVTSARITGAHYLVLGPSAERGPSAAFLRSQWEAQALVGTVAARFSAAGDRLVGYRMIGNCGPGASCASGGTLTVAGTPSVGPRGARQLRTAVLARAQAAGIAVLTNRVLPIGGGLLSVVVRLREDQLLDARAQRALTTLFGPVASAPGPLHFLSIEAPNGTSIGYGGTVVNGGNWNYGGGTGGAPVPRTAPAALWQARTDISVHITRGSGAPATDRTFRFTCGAGASAKGDCKRLLADRWSLLVPTAGGVCPASPAGAWNISVTGTFAGRAIARNYNGCYRATGLRWARFLGVA